MLRIFILLVGLQALADRRAGSTENGAVPVEPAGRGKKEETEKIVAGSVEGGEGVAGTVGNASVLLEGILRSAPTTRAKSAA